MMKYSAFKTFEYKLIGSVLDDHYIVYIKRKLWYEILECCYLARAISKLAFEKAI